MAHPHLLSGRGKNSRVRAWSEISKPLTCLPQECAIYYSSTSTDRPAPAQPPICLDRDFLKMSFCSRIFSDRILDDPHPPPGGIFGPGPRGPPLILSTSAGFVPNAPTASSSQRSPLESSWLWLHLLSLPLRPEPSPPEKTSGPGPRGPLLTLSTSAGFVPSARVLLLRLSARPESLPVVAAFALPSPRARNMPQGCGHSRWYCGCTPASRPDSAQRLVLLCCYFLICSEKSCPSCHQ